MFDTETIQEVINWVGTKERTDEIFNFSKKIYDLHQFNIKNLYPKEVKKMHQSLKRRYRKNQIQILPTNWNQGERRLFIWFIVSFMYLKQVSLCQLTEEYLAQLSQVFFGKAPIFIDFQLKNLPKATKQKRHWSVEEDTLLKKTINQLKIQDHSEAVFNNWNDVAKLIFFKTQRSVFKTPKSCRQRWYNHIDDSKKKDQFSPEEDLTIISYILKENKSWSKIVKLMNYSRTEHRIKNRYYTLLRKYQRAYGYVEELTEQLERSMLEKLKIMIESCTQAIQQQKGQIENVQQVSGHKEVKAEYEAMISEESNQEEKKPSKNQIQQVKIKTESTSRQMQLYINEPIIQQSIQSNSLQLRKQTCLSEKGSQNLELEKNHSKGTDNEPEHQQSPLRQNHQQGEIARLFGINPFLSYGPYIKFLPYSLAYHVIQPVEQGIEERIRIINQFYCPIIIHTTSQYQLFPHPN